MTVINLDPPVDRLPNDPRMEWVFQLADDMPPARLKMLIVQLASPEVDYLTKEQATIALDALGLRKE